MNILRLLWLVGWVSPGWPLLMASVMQFYSVVELVEKDGSVSSLLTVFNDQSFSDRIVQFLRLLTSAFIRNRADFFRHFVDEEMDIKDFCTHVGSAGAQALGMQPWLLSVSHGFSHHLWPGYHIGSSASLG